MREQLYRPQRNWGARIRVFDWQGMCLVQLENQLLCVGILAGKGTDIVELNYKPRDLDFAWLTPSGVVNPGRLSATAPNAQASFRDFYPGGWQEILPSGGNPSTHAGASYNQHGELFNVPWDVAIIEDTPERIAVTFTVRTLRSPFRLEKTVSLTGNQAGFNIQERLINEAPVETHAMWGHHITFGPPFLKPGHRIRVPENLIVAPHPSPDNPNDRRATGTDPFDWPMIPGSEIDLSIIPEPGTPSDVMYLSGFPPDSAWYEVVDPATGIGARVQWDASVMPHLWFWQEFGGSTEYPRYGRTYNIGLEPFSSAPGLGLAHAVQNGSSLRLGPHEEKSFALSYTILDPAERRRD